MACSPHAVEAAGGYFHLAAVFLRENKPQVAVSLHNKVSVNSCLHIGQCDIFTGDFYLVWTLETALD